MSAMPASYDTDRSREPEWECPPSGLADAIVHCDQVRPGDAMLERGVLAAVDAVDLDADQTAYVCITVRHAELNPSGGPVKVWRLRHRLAAVRRYQEGH